MIGWVSMMWLLRWCPQRVYHLHDIPAQGTWLEMGNKETSDGLWLVVILSDEMSVFFFFLLTVKIGKVWKTVQDWRRLQRPDNLMQCMILDWFLDQIVKRDIVDNWCLWIWFCDLDGSVLLMLTFWLKGMKRCYIWVTSGKIFTY